MSIYLQPLKNLKSWRRAPFLFKAVRREESALSFPKIYYSPSLLTLAPLQCSFPPPFRRVINFSPGGVCEKRFFDFAPVWVRVGSSSWSWTTEAPIGTTRPTATRWPNARTTSTKPSWPNRPRDMTVRSGTEKQTTEKMCQIFLGVDSHFLNCVLILNLCLIL